MLGGKSTFSLGLCVPCWEGEGGWLLKSHFSCCQAGLYRHRRITFPPEQLDWRLRGVEKGYELQHRNLKTYFISKLCFGFSPIRHLLSDSLRFTQSISKHTYNIPVTNTILKNIPFYTNVTYKSDATTLQFPGRSNLLFCTWSTHTPALPVVCSCCCWRHLSSSPWGETRAP